MKIVYLHGLGSVGLTPKSEALIEAFGSANVLTPDLPLDPEATIELVNALVKQLRGEKVVYVGTSLGGFWANYFAQTTRSPCVLVNPLMTPGQTFVSRIGSVAKNHVTGEETEFTTEIVQGFLSAQTEALDYDPDLVTLFLAEDDLVIDHQTTVDYVGKVVNCTVTKNGGHRYTLNWDLVIDALKKMVDN